MVKLRSGSSNCSVASCQTCPKFQKNRDSFICSNKVLSGKVQSILFSLPLKVNLVLPECKCIGQNVCPGFYTILWKNPNESFSQPNISSLNTIYKICWTYGHEFALTLGGSGGQRTLACCSPWGRKELDTT